MSEPHDYRIEWYVNSETVIKKMSCECAYSAEDALFQFLKRYPTALVQSVQPFDPKAWVWTGHGWMNRIDSSIMVHHEERRVETR